ncbi:MAG: hypothetical protein AAGJ50_09685, partial [Pseudomonadota bacterium]
MFKSIASFTLAVFLTGTSVSETPHHSAPIAIDLADDRYRLDFIHLRTQGAAGLETALYHAAVFFEQKGASSFSVNRALATTRPPDNMPMRYMIQCASTICAIGQQAT